MNRDEALKKSDEALKELAQSLKEGKSEKLVEYLGMLSRFHQYSFGNCMMIFMQNPDAKFVAGFGRWKELGRFVKKGEKGIAILAPLIGKRTSNSKALQVNSSEQPATKETDGKVLYGFRIVYVFDVSQTEGQELPEFASLGGDPGELTIERLSDVIRENGITLEFVDGLPGGANGMSSGGTISIVSALPKPQMFSTIVHELAHELLHWGDRRESTNKVVRETEAEAVAYVVCRSIGLDCSTRASDYIQIWDGDERVLMQSLELIRTVAAKIITQLEPVKTNSSEEVLHVA
jgi:antirestriction protein ArdC